MAITARSMMGPAPLDHIAALAERLGDSLLLQIREPDLSPRQLWRWCASVLEVCTPHRSQVFINDRLDVALSLGVGLHLPESGLPVAQTRRLYPGPLSVACHSPQAAVDAALAGADWVLLSPIFATLSKPGATPLTVAALTQTRAAWAHHGLHTRLLALGGMNAATIPAALAAGAHGYAAIRHFWDK